jgi:hypothetical protein
MNEKLRMKNVETKVTAERGGAEISSFFIHPS